METPAEVAAAAAHWARLTRWERAELGRCLRREGWTYSEIMVVLPVGKGTLSGWCQEIRLSNEQIEAIRARRPPGVRTGIPVDTQRKRRGEINLIRTMAAAEVRDYMSNPLWTAGVVLYWGEGSKTKPRLELTNTDARALRLFVAWVEQFHDPQAEYTLSLHLHAGNDEEAAKAYWSRALDLTMPRFYKTFVKPPGTGHRKNKLAHGVCRVSVRKSTDAFHRTMAWIDELASLCITNEALVSIRVAGATGSATDS